MRVRDGIRQQPAPQLRADSWPTGTELARLRDDGVTEVEVVQPIRLDERDPATLTSWLASLRDAASARVAVRWDGQVSLSPWVVFSVVHLSPPASTGSAADMWRDLHEGSSLYYRRGPGFVTIRDTRRSYSRADIVLDNPVELALFDRIARPTKVGDLTDFAPELATFLDAGLACRAADLVVGLATHLRRWPIPDTGI